MTDREMPPRPRLPSATEATGEFTAPELAAPPASRDPGATGEFTQVDVALPDDPPPTIRVTGGPPAPLAGVAESKPEPLLQVPAQADATGEFTVPMAPRGPGLPMGDLPTGEFSFDAPAARPGLDGTDQGRAGQATGQVPGKHTSPAYPGAMPAQATAPELRGEYDKLRFHAAGGMGEVWMAEDPRINRPVALKKMRPGMEKFTEHFLLEAQITGQLEHPGVVPVHAMGSDESGQPYYSMRFIHGRTLQSAIDEYHKAAKEKGPDEVAHLRLLQVFLSLCQTVAYAHSRGVLHRDLKPDNVMVGEYGETLLLDWGLAKLVGMPEPADPADPADAPASGAAEAASRPVRLTCVTDASQTSPGAIKGTPGYISPEAAAGANGQVDHVSDVYLLGATLFHILTGRPPRVGKNAITIITEARKTTPTTPRALNPAIPRPLEAICLKAMAFRKADRYQSAQALAEDLQRYLAGEPVGAHQETFLERTWRWMKKHRQALAWAAAGLVVLAGVLLGLAKWRQIEADHEEERRLARLEQDRIEAERKEAQEKADLAVRQDEARKRLARFRRLADETRFYAAIPDPAGEQAPAFRDMQSAEARGQEALALVTGWGPALEGLPLKEEQAPLRDEVADLLLLLAQTRLRQGGNAEGGKAALGMLGQAARLRTPSASLYRLRAQAHELGGDPQQAKEDQIRAKDPRTPLGAADHYLMGMARQAEADRAAGADAEGDAARAAREKRIRQAIEHYRAALRLDPKHYWANLQLGSSQLALGAPAEAGEALNACVALNAAAPWGYAVRGLALVAQKRFDDAKADLDKAIDLGGDFRLPKLNRGVAFWLQQKHAEALADFNAVLQPPEGQRLIEGAYYKGQVYLEREEFKEALAAFDQVVATRRTFRSLHLFRARCLLCLGEQAKALAALDLFLDEGKGYDPKSAQAAGERGRLLRVVLIPKLPPAALRQARVLAEVQLAAGAKGRTKSAAVYEDLGAIQEQLGQMEKAAASYTSALKLAPRNVKTLVKRGWVLADLTPPRLDDARDDFEEALGLDPANAEAHAGLGYVYACRKAPAEARRAAGRALLHGAGDYVVLHNVACIYARLAQADNKLAEEFEDIALDLIRREVELWRKGGKGPNALQMIQGEASFHKGLRDRPGFPKLMRDEG